MNKMYEIPNVQIREPICVDTLTGMAHGGNTSIELNDDELVNNQSSA